MAGVLDWVADNLPFTPIGRGILAAREQEEMKKYRQQMMQRQQQEFDTQQQQYQAAQSAFAPQGWNPAQILVTPQVGSPNYAQVRQQLDQVDPEGTTQLGIGAFKPQQAEMISGLAKAGQFDRAAQLAVANAPQDGRDPNVISPEAEAQKIRLAHASRAVPEPKPPNRTTYNMGEEEVTAEWDGEQWKEVSRAPRYKPASPQGETESWGQPVTEAGPDGKPIQVRYGNRGGRQIVEGATPAPRSRTPGVKVIADTQKAGTNLETMTRLLEGFQDRYGGRPLTGDISNMIGRTFGDDTGQAQWWQDYQSYMNQIRNQLFGSALTATEKSEFLKAQVTPGMAPTEIRKNLDRQKELFRASALRQVKPYLALGTDKEALEGALGMSIEDLESPPAASTADNDGWTTLPNGIRIREKR